jgi:hypothetical protein
MVEVADYLFNKKAMAKVCSRKHSQDKYLKCVVLQRQKVRNMYNKTMTTFSIVLVILKLALGMVSYGI